MNGGSIEQELARIEAALARVEAFSRSKPAPRQDGKLVERHEALKQAVSRTIAEIDAMIAEEDT